MERKKRNKIDGRSIFDLISEKFFFLLKSGIFGKFFTSYDEANEKYLQSRRRKKKTVGQGRFKAKVSRTIERSILVKNVPRLTEWLLRVSTRSYGIILFTIGVIIASLYPLNGYILIIDATFNMLISGIAVGVLGIPLICSKKSVSLNIYNSKLCSALLFDFLGLDKEKMRLISKKESVSMPNLAILVGIALGIMSLFVTPLKLIAIVGVIVLSYCVLCRPETGVLATVIILPFASIATLQISVVYVFICYTLKCMTGKRTFKFEHFDIWVVLALFVTLVRGAISSDFKTSVPSTLSTTCLILMYFVIINLIRTKEWFRRCLISLVISGTTVAVIGIVQVVLGKLSIYVPELTKLFTNGQSAIGTFDNPNTFAHYLVAILPFSMVHFISERNGGKKLGGILISAVMLVAMCLANSLSGIVGFIFATLLLLTIFNRNYTYLSLVICIMCPLLYFTLPQNALEKLLSLKMLEGVSILDIVSETREGFALFLQKPFGIGSGEEVFKNTFGTNEGYFDNLILQYLIEYGIVAILVFVIFILMLIRLTFSYCEKAKNQYRKINCCAGFCAVTGLIVSGIVNYTWYDKRIFLMFWILVAFSFTYIRIEKDEEEPEGLIDDYTTATLDIIISEDANNSEAPKRRYVRIPKNTDKVKRDELDEKEKERQYDEFENSSEFKIISNEVEKPLEILDVTGEFSKITDTSSDKSIKFDFKTVDKSNVAVNSTADVTEESTQKSDVKSTENVNDETNDTNAENVGQSNNIAEDAVFDKIENTTEDVAEETTEDIVEEITEDVVEEITEDVVEETTENVAEKATENVAEKATENVIEETADKKADGDEKSDGDADSDKK